MGYRDQPPGNGGDGTGFEKHVSFVNNNKDGRSGGYLSNATYTKRFGSKRSTTFKNLFFLYDYDTPEKQRNCVENFSKTPFGWSDIVGNRFKIGTIEMFKDGIPQTNFEFPLDIIKYDINGLNHFIETQVNKIYSLFLNFDWIAWIGVEEKTREMQWKFVTVSFARHEMEQTAYGVPHKQLTFLEDEISGEMRWAGTAIEWHYNYKTNEREFKNFGRFVAQAIQLELLEQQNQVILDHQRLLLIQTLINTPDQLQRFMDRFPGRENITLEDYLKFYDFPVTGIFHKVEEPVKALIELSKKRIEEYSSTMNDSGYGGPQWALLLPEHLIKKIIENATNKYYLFKGDSQVGFKGQSDLPYKSLYVVKGETWVFPVKNFKPFNTALSLSLFQSYSQKLFSNSFKNYDWDVRYDYKKHGSIYVDDATKKAPQRVQYSDCVKWSLDRNSLMEKRTDSQTGTYGDENYGRHTGAPRSYYGTIGGGRIGPRFGSGRSTRNEKVTVQDVLDIYQEDHMDDYYSGLVNSFLSNSSPNYKKIIETVRNAILEDSVSLVYIKNLTAPTSSGIQSIHKEFGCLFGAEGNDFTKDIKQLFRIVNNLYEFQKKVQGSMPGQGGLVDPLEMYDKIHIFRILIGGSNAFDYLIKSIESSRMFVEDVLKPATQKEWKTQRHIPKFIAEFIMSITRGGRVRIPSDDTLLTSAGWGPDGFNIRDDDINRALARYNDKTHRFMDDANVEKPDLLVEDIGEMFQNIMENCKVDMDLKIFWDIFVKFNIRPAFNLIFFREGIFLATSSAYVRKGAMTLLLGHRKINTFVDHERGKVVFDHTGAFGVKIRDPNNLLFNEDIYFDAWNSESRINVEFIHKMGKEFVVQSSSDTLRTSHGRIIPQAVTVKELRRFKKSPLSDVHGEFAPKWNGMLSRQDVQEVMFQPTGLLRRYANSYNTSKYRDKRFPYYKGHKSHNMVKRTRLAHQAYEEVWDDVKGKFVKEHDQTGPMYFPLIDLMNKSKPMKKMRGSIY